MTTLTDKGFRGNLHFLESMEGFSGKPYIIRGTQSGVTIDPGVDLGYVDRELFEYAYRPLVVKGQWTEGQYKELTKAFGKKGEAAVDFFNSNKIIHTIRIARKTAENILNITAVPYWVATTDRFPHLLDSDVPPCIHTVALSLAYNRGSRNRDLSVLNDPIEKKDWLRYAQLVDDMQNGSKLEGRRDEEADLIRKKYRDYFRTELKPLKPLPLETL